MVALKNSGFIYRFALLIGFFFAQANAAGQPAVDLVSLNILTFAPLKSVAGGQELPSEFAVAEKGIKQVIERVKLKQEIDTKILVSNAKTKKQTLVSVHRGVPQESAVYDRQTIFLYSPGWLVGLCGRTVRSDGFAKDIEITASNGVGAHLVYRYMRFGLLNGTTVTFDYPTDSRSLVNGGQQADVVYLKTVYDEVARCNPQANIVLVGDCKGGTTILNLITHPECAHQLQQVKGVIVESPPASFKHLAYAIAAGYLGGFRLLGYLIHQIFRLGLPGYKADGSQHSVLNATQKNIPARMPILIGHITDEELIANKDIDDMGTVLRSTNNPEVRLYTTPRFIKDSLTNKNKKLTHARLGKVLGYQQAVNTFCQQCGFPFDAQLAVQSSIDNC